MSLHRVEHLDRKLLSRLVSLAVRYSLFATTLDKSSSSKSTPEPSNRAQTASPIMVLRLPAPCTFTESTPDDSDDSRERCNGEMARREEQKGVEMMETVV